jgi:hypothetical protein
MESPTTYPVSPMDGDEVAFPCKGCGEVCFTHFLFLCLDQTELTPGQILEEGKAFELGNRLFQKRFFDTDKSQLETGGTSIASAVTPAAHFSILMRTSSFSVMGHLFATTAHTVAVTVGAK